MTSLAYLNSMHAYLHIAQYAAVIQSWSQDFLEWKEWRLIRTPYPHPSWLNCQLFLVRYWVSNPQKIKISSSCTRQQREGQGVLHNLFIASTFVFGLVDISPLSRRCFKYQDLYSEKDPFFSFVNSNIPLQKALSYSAMHRRNQNKICTIILLHAIIIPLSNFR